MFCHRQLGEVEDDIFYAEQVLRDDLTYAQAMLDQPIPDYEKERWQAEISQSSSMLANMGIPDSNYSEMFGYELDILTAGFSLPPNWPIFAILGIGALMMFKKSPKLKHRRKRSKRK